MHNLLAEPHTTINPLPDEADWLGFETTVPRALVHKNAVSEVLVTDSRAVSTRTILCAAQLPPLHRLHGPRAGHHELLGIAEATRQAAELIAHRHLGVAQTQAFIFRSIELHTVNREALSVEGPQANLVFELTLENQRGATEDPTSFELLGTLHLNGRPIGAGRGSCLFIKPKDYETLRGTPSTEQGTPEPTFSGPDSGRALPDLVGRMSSDVTITPPCHDDETTEACLVVDRLHPSFFDHPQDHVPGSLLLESLRQLALARACALSREDASAWLLTGVTATFDRFAEPYEPVRCVARGRESNAGFAFTFEAHQANRVLHGSATVEHV
jgi:2-oxo-3-(phosphooxy)propyl 3-oxoalkanoate synthase